MIMPPGPCSIHYTPCRFQEYHVATTTPGSGLVTYRITYKDLAPASADTLLTVKEVAGRLSIGRTTVYELIARGDLPAIRIGRARRIPASALDRFIAERTE